MEKLSFNPDHLEFIFLSHIHSDHLKGVESLCFELDLPVVIHENLDLDKYTKGEINRKLSVTPGREYTFRYLSFIPFETHHDAPSSLGFYFRLGDISFTVITDTGKYDPSMIAYAEKSHILFLESNYSEEMLMTGKYPPYLKERIRSDKGHLSNFQAADFLKEVTGSERCMIEQIYLCHLSKNNNSVEKVLSEIGKNCSNNIPLRVCDRGESVSGIPLQARRSTLVPGGSSSLSSYSEISAF